MLEEPEYHSIVLPDMPTRALDRTILWCRDRAGSENTEDNPDGRWAWTIIPGTGTVITLPSPELMFEMRLVQPWNT